MAAMEKQLEQLIDEFAPPMIDDEALDQLLRCAEDSFDGDCTVHEGCRSLH